MKFSRSYEIRILTPAKKLVTIVPPFTIKCSVTRSVTSSPNECQLTIFNLSPSSRSIIFKDPFDVSEYWQMVVLAGYTGKGESGLRTIFQGDIMEAMSYREGTEWVTSITGRDGLYALQNGFTSQTIEADTDKRSILQKLIADLPNLIKGSFGSEATGTAPRGQVLVGQTWDVMQDQTDGQFFVDNEKLNVLADDEILSGKAFLLDSEQLLSTPKRREAFLDCEIIFTPELAVGQAVEIQSRQKEYNGLYKVLGFTHDFEISGANCGDARTSLQLYTGNGALKVVA